MSPWADRQAGSRAKHCSPERGEAMHEVSKRVRFRALLEGGMSKTAIRRELGVSRLRSVSAAVAILGFAARPSSSAGRNGPTGITARRSLACAPSHLLGVRAETGTIPAVGVCAAAALRAAVPAGGRRSKPSPRFFAAADDGGADARGGGGVRVFRRGSRCTSWTSADGRRTWCSWVSRGWTRSATCPRAGTGRRCSSNSSMRATNPHRAAPGHDDRHPRL